MKEKRQTPSSRFANVIERLPLLVKVLFLITSALILLPIFVREVNLRGYYCVLISFVVLVTLAYSVLAGREIVISVLSMWAVGVLIYVVVSVFLVVFNLPLSPYLTLSTPLDRWLYLFSWPVRMLGTLITGLIFIRITSPIEFIKYGEFGWWLALLFRMTQYASEGLVETKAALRMQGEWPEQANSFRDRIRAPFLAIKSSPKLIATTTRNSLLWVPWASLCFMKIRSSIGQKEK